MLAFCTVSSLPLVLMHNHMTIAGLTAAYTRLYHLKTTCIREPDIQQGYGCLWVLFSSPRASETVQETLARLRYMGNIQPPTP